MKHGHQPPTDDSQPLAFPVHERTTAPDIQCTGHTEYQESESGLLPFTTNAISVADLAFP